MDDTVEATVEGGLDHLGVGDVPADDLDARIGVRLQVDDAHVGARGGQRGDGMPTDEARPAGDQHALAPLGHLPRCSRDRQRGGVRTEIRIGCS